MGRLSKLFAGAALAALLVVPGLARAGQVYTDNIPVVATVVSSCVLGAAPLNFGSVDPMLLSTKAITATGLISMLCGNTGEVVYIGINLGANPTGLPIGATRAMLGPSPTTSPPSDFLVYDVFVPGGPTITSGHLTEYTCGTTDYGPIGLWWGPLGGVGNPDTNEWSGVPVAEQNNEIEVCGYLGSGQPAEANTDTGTGGIGPGIYTDTLVVTAAF